MISYILYRTGFFLAGALPPACSRRIAVAIAFLFFSCRPRIRSNVRANFERLGLRPKSVFPVFGAFSRAVLDMLRLSRMSRDEIAARCRVRGVEHLDRALGAGKGAILFAPHLGSWEVAGACISGLGYRIHTVALEHPSARVTRFLSEKRARWGVRDYSSRACGAALTKALAAGETVVLLVDRSFSRRGTTMRFLGSDVELPDGHVTLSLRSGAPLVPCCSWYAPDDTIEILIGEAIRPPKAHDRRAATAAACIARIEEFVRSHPEQWFAFDHLWRNDRHA